MATLEQQNTAFIDANEKLNTKTDSITSSTSNLNTHIKNRKAEIDSLTNAANEEISNLKQLIATHKQNKKDSLDKSNDGYTGEAIYADAQITLLESKINNIEKEKKSYSNYLKQGENLAKEATRLKDGIIKKSNNLQKTVEKANKKIERLEKFIQINEKSISTYETVIAEKTEKLKSLQQTASNFESKKEVLSHDIEQQQKSLEKPLRLQSKLKSDINRLERILADLQNQTDKATIQDLQARLDKLNDKNPSEKTTVPPSADLVEFTKNLIDQKREQLSTVKETCSNINSKIKSKQDELSNHLKTNYNPAEKVQQLKERISELEKNKSVCQSDIKKLESKQAKQAKVITKATDNLDKLAKQAEATQNVLGPANRVYFSDLENIKKEDLDDLTKASKAAAKTSWGKKLAGYGLMAAGAAIALTGVGLAAGAAVAAAGASIVATERASRSNTVKTGNKGAAIAKNAEDIASLAKARSPVIKDSKSTAATTEQINSANNNQIETSRNSLGGRSK